jgi:hypothetical protein
MANQIGFRRGEKKRSSPIAPEKRLFRFDSGRSISFQEAGMHTIVSGSTGSGKTASVILPAIGRLLSAGFSGLIVDIKGNLTGQTRALASLCGREKDILEIGTGHKAHPMNLLAGLDDSQTHELIRSMTDSSQNGIKVRNESYFTLSGINSTAEIIKMLRLLARGKADFTPTITGVAEMLNNYALCAQVYKYFESVTAWMDETSEEKTLLRRIQMNAFHPCLWQDNASTRKNNARDYDQQVEWAMRLPRYAFTEFAETPGIGTGFASPSASGFTLADEIYDNGKIVLLSFDPTSGGIAEGLSRYYLEEYYKAVLKRGLDLPEGRYTFAVIDEFQDIVCLDGDNRYNDAMFTAKAREFNNILIVATQSLSALGNRSKGNVDVEAFINNCNNKILLYCEDPWTQSMVERHTQADLCHMEPGEAVVIKFDAQCRRHTRTREAMQNAFEETRDALAPFPVEKRKPPKAAAPLNHIKKLAAKVIVRTETDLSSNNSQDATSVAPPKDRNENVEQPRIVAEFPEFFPTAMRNNECYVNLEVPSGWHNVVASALKKIRDSGLSLDIVSFSLTSGRTSRQSLAAEVKGHDVADRILNRMLSATGDICLSCGERLEEDGALLCRKCGDMHCSA